VKALLQRCDHAEAANARLTAELGSCQEQLHASERAKATLQSHLHLLMRPEEACAAQGVRCPGR
jgi:hypothetical protein